MPRDRKNIESSLSKKGFKVERDKHHRYYKYYVDGKYTGAYTFISHGSSYKVYGDDLLSKIRKQLKLNNKNELLELIDCPMDEQKYREILESKGLC